MLNDTVSTARSRNRAEIPDRFKWNVQDIFQSWEEWDAAFELLVRGVPFFPALEDVLDVPLEAIRNLGTIAATSGRDGVVEHSRSHYSSWPRRETAASPGSWSLCPLSPTLCLLPSTCLLYTSPSPR